MQSPRTQPPSARPWRQRPSVWALFAAAGFVLGLFAGGIAVGFAAAGPAPPIPRATVTRAAPAPPLISSSNAAATARAVVNAACLRAINDSQTSYAGVGRLVDAVRSLKAAHVDQAILRLQPVREQLQRDLRECRVVAAVPTAPPGSGAVRSPTPSR